MEVFIFKTVKDTQKHFPTFFPSAPQIEVQVAERPVHLTWHAALISGSPTPVQLFHGTGDVLHVQILEYHPG